MIGSCTVLAVIPARGGSKGVPQKNIRSVGRKPLIAWTIEAAKTARYVDRVVLSSDDRKIIDVAESYGCDIPFIRPVELATDEADSMSVVRHAIASLNERYDYLVLLQPTSPLRCAQDIDAAIERCVNADAKACVSVSEPDKSPYWMFRIDEAGALCPLLAAEKIPDRRQNAPPVVALNGAVYVARIDYLAGGGTFLAPGTVGYTMPKERSFDIDTELDLRIVDFLLNEGQR
jgi:N-acylneuraminate cytidylyltransferase